MVAGDLSLVFVAHDGQDAADFEVRRLVQGGGVESQPRFSPDGEWIAFGSTGSQAEPVGLSDVYVVAAAGGEVRKLADTHDRSANVVGWSAEGDHVLVLETVGTTQHLQAVPVDGSPTRLVTSGNGVVGSVSFSAGAEDMAFTWQTPDAPWDVFVSDVRVGERTVGDVDLDALTMGDAPWSPRRITDLHAEVDRPPMGKTELLTWKSEDGRFDIQGLLTYPVGYHEGDRVPLILNVHGGPAGAFTQSFTGGPSIYMVQTFAQQGYAVLRPNPRGSTGYGKDFRFANVRDWGYGDMDDLMAGVDRVIEMGVGDPERLLLMGWSYGGYMTSFAVTRTDRFKAASMGAGLPNLISMVTTTDIQDYLAAHLDSEFWDDYEAYERHSAMYRIGRVTTPTQVIHGENDLRVPFTQGQEFYRALQRRGVDTEMLILPRTPHGPQEPKLLMEVTPRILAWFEKYLPQDRITTQPQPGPEGALR
jgi:dipeptidyl aminopeptidase/acylaminoacyl peptidase